MAISCNTFTQPAVDYALAGKPAWNSNWQSRARPSAAHTICKLGLTPGMCKQEGAKRGKLGESPYKALNIGILGAGAGHLAVLTPILLSGGGGPFLPALLGLWGVGAAVSGTNLLKNGSA